MQPFILPLVELGILICCFDASLTVTQAVHLSSLRESTVSSTKMWE
jgi:hypothetical protein